MTGEFAVNDLYRVAGQVAVVSGGGTGLGLMITRALVDNGAKTVYIIGRRLEKLQQAAEQFGAGGKIVPLVGDVTSKADLARIAEQVEAQTGYVDLLVNNSGIMGPKVTNMAQLRDSGDVEGLYDAMWNQDSGSWDQVMATNSTAVYFASVAFIKLLAAGNKRRSPDTIVSSQIITISSIAGLMRFSPASMAYNVSKAAAISVTKILGNLFTEIGIRCNVICPGIFPSEMTGEAADAAGRSHLDLDEATRNLIPVRRAGHEREFAELILMLASNGFVSGATITIDGGRLHYFPSTA